MGQVKRSRVNSETLLTFRSSIQLFVGIMAFFGFGTFSKQRYEKLYYVFFVIHLLVVVINAIGFYLKSTFASDDVQVVAYSVTGLLVHVNNVTVRILYGMSSRKVIDVFTRTGELLEKFNGEEQPFLRRLRRTTYMLCIPVILVTVIQYLSYIEKYFNIHVNYEGGHASFISQYYLVFITDFIFAPLAIAFTFAANLVRTAMAITMTFVFENLPKPQKQAIFSPKLSKRQCTTSLNDVIKLVAINREACEVLRMGNEAFAAYSFVGALTLLCMMPVSLRVAIISNHGISPASLCAAGFVFGYFSLYTLLNSTLNQKLKSNLDDLVAIGLELQTERKIPHRKIPALLAKIDLYLTHVSLNDPSWTLGGLLKYRPHIVVMVCGFVLNYTIILYSK